MIAHCAVCDGNLDSNLVCRYCAMNLVADDFAKRLNKAQFALAIATTCIEKMRGFLTTYDASGEKKDLATKCLKDIEDVLK